MEAEIRELLTQTVEARPFLGRDGFGKPEYGMPVYYKGRVTYKSEVIRDFSGSEQTSTAQVILVPEAIVGPEYDVTIPQQPWQGEPKKMEVIGLGAPVDEEGKIYYVKVWLR